VWCKKQIGVRSGIRTGFQAEQSKKIPDLFVFLPTWVRAASKEARRLTRRTKKEGHSTFSSLADLCPCVSVYQILLSSSSSGMGWVAWRFPNVRALREHRRLLILSSSSCSRRSSLDSFFSSLSGGVAREPFTARIGRAHSYRARSASKKGTWPLLPLSYCWIPDSSHFSSWDRVKVQASPDSVGVFSLPSTM